MTLSVRFSTSPNAVLQHSSGRTYTANSSGICDVPYTDGQSINSPSTAGAPLRMLGFVGATSDRPVPNGATNWPPASMLDTTLSKQIYWTGSGWVDATGAAV